MVAFSACSTLPVSASISSVASVLAWAGSAVVRNVAASAAARTGIRSVGANVTGRSGLGWQAVRQVLSHPAFEQSKPQPAGKEKLPRLALSDGYPGSDARSGTFLVKPGSAW